jgi:hypothetical protein
MSNARSSPPPPHTHTRLPLPCSGTIEEKIYHRQIFKHLLSKRILTDPRQTQMLSAKNLRDLFTLTEYAEGSGVVAVVLCMCSRS